MDAAAEPDRSQSQLAEQHLHPSLDLRGGSSAGGDCLLRGPVGGTVRIDLAGRWGRLTPSRRSFTVVTIGAVSGRGLGDGCEEGMAYQRNSLDQVHLLTGYKGVVCS